MGEGLDRSAACEREIRKALWRALGEASMNSSGSDPYLDRLFIAIARNGLEVRRV